MLSSDSCQTLPFIPSLRYLQCLLTGVENYLAGSVCHIVECQLRTILFKAKRSGCNTVNLDLGGLWAPGLLDLLLMNFKKLSLFAIKSYRIVLSQVLFHYNIYYMILGIMGIFQTFLHCCQVFG